MRGRVRFTEVLDPTMVLAPHAPRILLPGRGTHAARGVHATDGGGRRDPPEQPDPEAEQRRRLQVPPLLGLLLPHGVSRARVGRRLLPAAGTEIRPLRPA